MTGVYKRKTRYALKMLRLPSGTWQEQLEITTSWLVVGKESVRTPLWKWIELPC